MASLLVAAPAGNGGSMGEVVEVPGTTEQELRQAVIEQITELCKPLLPLEPGEVTVGDVMKAWGRPIASTRTLLDAQVREGTMTKRKALDPRTGRECTAYRVVENPAET